MRIEDGYIVIDPGEDWSPLGPLTSGDQYQYPSHAAWQTYPEYNDAVTFTGNAPFPVRRALSKCSAELLAKVGIGAETMHFL